MTKNWDEELLFEVEYARKISTNKIRMYFISEKYWLNNHFWIHENVKFSYKLNDFYRESITCKHGYLSSAKNWFVIRTIHSTKLTTMSVTSEWIIMEICKSLQSTTAAIKIKRHTSESYYVSHYIFIATHDVKQLDFLFLDNNVIRHVFRALLEEIMH